MNLSKSAMSISKLLRLMEGQEPESILLNHLVIGENEMPLPFNPSLDHLPCFTVQFPGFVEVEMYMDSRQERVVRLCVRQSAMTFEELDDNGDVLPNITIDCTVLDANERKQLDAKAKHYIHLGKVRDKTRAEGLLTEYVAKAMFSSRKYGSLNHA